jgi:hypothetical protein
VKVKWSVTERNRTPGFGLARLDEDAGAVCHVVKADGDVAELKRLLLEM